MSDEPKTGEALDVINWVYEQLRGRPLPLGTGPYLVILAMSVGEGTVRWCLQCNTSENVYTMKLDGNYPPMVSEAKLVDTTKSNWYESLMEDWYTEYQQNKF